MRLFHRLLTHLDSLQTLVQPAFQENVQSLITVHQEWQVLGPFTIGTREALWGSDPLERLGGFHRLEYNDTKQFTSSLASNGTIFWSSTQAQIVQQGDTTLVGLSVSFPSVDWKFLQQIYGWAALQWQGWARGSFEVEDTVTIDLHMEHILECWIDDSHYIGGDFYGYHNAPIVLHLKPGKHTIELRLIRDVRSMGGITNNPTVDVAFSMMSTIPRVRQTGKVLYPDRLDDFSGPIASRYASVMLRNDNDTDAYIHTLTVKRGACLAELIADTPIKLSPGQSRPIAFKIACISGTSAVYSIYLNFAYYLDTPVKEERVLFVGILAERPVPRETPHIFTYQHPSGVVSHSILRPPSMKVNCPVQAPILIGLHGAGVEVSTEEARHALDGLDDICAWILLPSGVTSWSGDDWHNWGWADVQAAINAIPQWIEDVDWQGPSVDMTRWLVAGHSNGGQGVWYALTHHSDNIIAAAPLSGYSSIQNYVPYTFWQFADPARTAIVQAQLNGYRHELLLENAQGIPLLQQHGSADENVPAFHSRLMFDLLQRADANDSYLELEGRGHWWDGVMTTPALTAFYKQHLDVDARKSVSDVFTVVSTSPGDTNGRHGVSILALRLPGQLGRVTVSRSVLMSCDISSENIEIMQLDAAFLNRCKSISIDRQFMNSDVDFMIVLKTQSGHWTIIDSPDRCRRSPSQQGGLEAILRTNGTFQIVQHSKDVQHTAIQVANNLVQYFLVDTEIGTSYEHAMNSSGNIISIAIGRDLPASSMECQQACQVRVNEVQRLQIRKGDDILHKFDTEQDAVVAAAYLRPLHDNRLELVFWATDIESLLVATRLLPIMTGSGFPDFIITTRGMLERGIEGVSAMGFWDDSWCPSSTSFIVD